MQPFALVMVLFLSGYSPVLATALYAPDDSAAAVRERAIIVTTDSLRTDGWYDGVAVTRIPKPMLQRLAPTTVADVLATVPGLFVRDYGGLGGMRTVSIRGGSASQSLVLLNGVRLASAQNGMMDLSTIPVSMLGDVRVMRGGASAIYGANALTGVVDLRLERPRTTAIQATAEQASFETERYAMDAAIAGEDASVHAGVDVRTGRGAYPFAMSSFGNEAVINRSNSDMHSLGLSLQGYAGRAFSVMAFARSVDRGVPGAAVQGNLAQAKARLQDNDVMASVRYTSGVSSWDVESSLAVRVFDQHYVDPDATFVGAEGIDERYVLRDMAANIQARRVWSDVSVTANMEGGWTDLRGGGMQPGVADPVIRRTAALRALANWELLHDSMGVATISMQGALRGDIVSDAGNAVSPLVSVRWLPADVMSVRASWGYNFRAPSFNELYYLNYGTSTLASERAHSYNLGATYRGLEWLSVDADLFAQFTSNLIVAIPISPVITSAQNVGSASTVGAEISARATLFDDAVYVWHSYTIQDARDRTGRTGLDGTAIPYVPPEMLQVGASYRDARWSASLQWSYTSYRYAQPGAEPTSLLQPYSTLRGAVGTHGRVADMDASFEIVVDNALATEYAVVRGYPMPGAFVRANIVLRWGKS